MVSSTVRLCDVVSIYSDIAMVPLYYAQTNLSYYMITRNIAPVQMDRPSSQLSSVPTLVVKFPPRARASTGSGTVLQVCCGCKTRGGSSPLTDNGNSLQFCTNVRSALQPFDSML